VIVIVRQSHRCDRQISQDLATAAKAKEEQIEFRLKAELRTPVNEFIEMIGVLGKSFIR
jgi:hypothetical protein